jgi:hypothetical protein
MEKKMYKYTSSQNDNLKNMKKPKEIKLLTNYIPVKKTHAQSNISEYETEQSIQKNFSNKCQKNKANSQARSVQTTRTNQLSPKKIFNQNRSKGNFSNVSKSSKGSFYSLNNLNIYDYFSEKVILTQKKFIDYKNNKINTLKKELSLIKREINMYEKKYMNGNNNSKNKNMNNNSKNSSMNKNNSKNKIIPKILYVNKSNNKYYLVNNNNSYMSLNTFCNNNENMNNVEENVNKKLEKHLSNLLTENISNINVKNKNNKRNKNMNENKKNLLNIIYQSKKGYYNHNNNNYEHNTKNIIKTKDINIKKENSFKDKNLEKDIKHNLYFYTNKIKEKQVKIIDNKKTKKNDNVNSLQIDSEYQILNERVNKLFNCFFDYYDKNNQNEN